MDLIFIYTDGSCPGNQHKNAPGGYGVVILSEDGKYRKELSKGFSNTTNNRMELRGVLAGLSALGEKGRVKVVTDSKYITEAINQGWLEKWQNNGWRNAQKKRVANRDLWEMLVYLLARHEVEFQWVSSHSGHPENAWCDYLAQKAAHGDSGPLVPDPRG